jgi:hypothetical protein
MARWLIQFLPQNGYGILGGKKELEHISREIYITGKRNFSKNVEV